MRRNIASYDYNYYSKSWEAAAAREIWMPCLHGQPFWFYLQTVLVVGVIYLLLAGLILAYTSVRFDAIVGRAAQKRPLASGPTISS
jgi:hypothetical protein